MPEQSLQEKCAPKANKGGSLSERDVLIFAPTLSGPI
jgi:hypothetical protein